MRWTWVVVAVSACGARANETVLTCPPPTPPPATAAAAATPTPTVTAPTRADDTFPYQTPPADLVALADAPLPQRILAGPDDNALLLLDVPPLIPVSELSQPELKLAGIRFDPINESVTRATYFRALAFLDPSTGASKAVTGVPADGRMRQPKWSPDGKHVAFIVSLADHVEVWVADRATGAAHRLGDRAINAAHPSSACRWLGNDAVVCRVVPDARGPAPAESTVPHGPRVEESTGKKTPAPTFEDLLHDEHDAALFEHHFTSEVWTIGLDGAQHRIGGPALVVGLDTSPDAAAILVTTTHRPFSYHVPWERFPQRSEVWDASGKQIALVADVPLAAEVPIDNDAVPTGRREIAWRADAPATLTWVEAKDGGDPKVEAAVRDEVYQLAAPFSAAPTLVASLALRFKDVAWSSGSLAVVTEQFWKTRQTREWQVAPDQPGAKPRKLVDRLYEDRYSNPGELQLRPTPRGTWVLWTNAAGTQLVRFGEGASPKGDYPFVDAVDLATLKATRRWQSTPGSYEVPLALSS